MSLRNYVQSLFTISYIVEDNRVVVLRSMQIKLKVLDDIIRDFMSRGSHTIDLVNSYKCTLDSIIWFLNGDEVINLISLIDSSASSSPRIIKGEEGGLSSSRIHADDTAFAYYEISGLFSTLTSYGVGAIYNKNLWDVVLSVFQPLGISQEQRQQFSAYRKSHKYRLRVLSKTNWRDGSNIIDIYLTSYYIIQFIRLVDMYLNANPIKVKRFTKSDEHLLRIGF